MAESTYTISLIDNASSQARRVARAMDRVAVQAQQTADAVGRGAKEDIKKARAAERLARAELRAARALKASGDAARRAARPARIPKAVAKDVASLQPKGSGRRGKSGRKPGLGQGFAAGFAALGLGAAIKSLASLGRSMIEATGKADAFQRGMTDISKDGKDITLSDNWNKEILRLNIPLEQGRQDVMGLLAAMKDVGGINAGKAVNDILKLNSALRLTKEQSKSFNKVFRDIAGKGKVQREELTTQLAEIGTGITIPGFLKEVAKAYGTDLKGAEKLLSKGKISSDVGIQALITAQAAARGIKDLSAAADRAAKGPLGTLNALDNSALLLKESLGQKLIDSGALDGLRSIAKGMRGLSDWIDDLDIHVFKGVLITLGLIGGALTGLAIAAGVFWLAATLPISAAIAAGLALGAVIVGAVAGFTSFMGGFDMMATNFAEGLIMMGHDFLMWSGELAMSALIWGRNLMNSFLDGLKAGWAKTKDFVSGIGNSIKDFFGIETSVALSDQAGTGPGALGIDPELGAEMAVRQAMQGTNPAMNSAQLSNTASSAAESLTSSMSQGGSSMGDVNVQIQVDGSKSPEETGAAVQSMFEHQMGALFDQHMQGKGG